MTDLSYASILFFALPGFYTLFLIRHIALYNHTMTHAEFVFYSLALSTPSYIFATVIVGDGGTTAVAAVQSGIAVAGGGIAGYVIKKVWRSKIHRETPWHSFMLDNTGNHVIVYTATRRYCGWLKSVSTDYAPRRELVLGDPTLIKSDGRKIRMGEEMMFTEAEIARVVRVVFDNGKGHTE